MSTPQQAIQSPRTRDSWASIFNNPEANRIAKEATRQAKRELDDTPRHLLDPGNPNHPDNFTCPLFGYPEAQFLRKQYK